MADNIVVSALRRDAARLLERSPAPAAAALWHVIQRERARRVQRIMNLAGWSLRAAIVVILAGVTVSAPQELIRFAAPLALVYWLSTGICSPLPLASARRPGRTSAMMA